MASTFYTGALQTVTYDIPTLSLPRLPRVHQQAAVRTQARARHAAEPLRAGSAARQDRRAARRSIRPSCGCASSRRRTRLTANYLRIGTIGLAECIRRVVARSGWREKFRQLPLGRGVGLACSSYLSGAGLPINWNDLPHSGVQLKLDRSGGVTAFCGATEIGQGSDDVLVACVAEVLGIDPFDIRAVTGDTDLTPVDLGSYSSRVTLMMGNAAIQAADARARAARAGRRRPKLDIPLERVAFADRRVFDGDAPERGVTFQEAVCMAEAQFGTIGTTGSYTPPKSAAQVQGRRRRPVADVFLHRRGRRGGRRSRHRLDRRAARVDCARHRPRAQSDARARPGRGQRLHGARRGADGRAGVPPAAAAALARAGAQVPVDPRIQEPDVPRHAGGHHRPRSNRWIPAGPFGAKEVGQGPLLPIMPAVANAVYDAVGVRIDEIPVTPEKILKALTAKAAGKPARYGPASFPRHPLAGAAAGDAALGRRRRPRVERAGAAKSTRKADARRRSRRREVRS